MSVLMLIAGILTALVGNKIADRSPEFGYWWFGLWTLVSIAMVIVNILTSDWGWAAWMSVCAAANAWHWRNHRRKRKRRRAMAAIGAKSRAIRDAMVRKVRQAAKPRRVLRPAPGGAR